MELNLAEYKNRHSKKSKVARLLWTICWTLLARWTPDRFLAVIFVPWRIFLLRLFGAKIGKHCAVRNSARIWAPWNLECGDWVAISEHCDIYSVDKIRIGDRVTVSQNAFLCCASHDVTTTNMELVYKPITIGSDAWIAARTIILSGVEIGEGVVVAAGAVVTKAVEPWIIVAGNPAKVVKKRELKHD